MQILQYQDQRDQPDLQVLPDLVVLAVQPGQVVHRVLMVTVFLVELLTQQLKVLMVIFISTLLLIKFLDQKQPECGLLVLIWWDPLVQRGQPDQRDPLAPMALRDRQVLLGQQVQQEQRDRLGLQDQRVLLVLVDRRVHLDRADLAVQQVLQLLTLGVRRCLVERLHSLETMTTPLPCPTP